MCGWSYFASSQIQSRLIPGSIAGELRNCFFQLLDLGSEMVFYEIQSLFKQSDLAPSWRVSMAVSNWYVRILLCVYTTSSCRCGKRGSGWNEHTLGITRATSLARNPVRSAAFEFVFPAAQTCGKRPGLMSVGFD
jgi:hypothetical protein